MSNLEKEIKYGGYNPDFDIIKPSKEIIVLGDSLKGLEVRPTRPSKLKDVKKRTDIFYTEIYRLHEVPFAYKRSFFKIFNFSLNMSTLDPLRLPIHLIQGQDEFYGCLRGYLDIENDEYVATYYRFIELSKELRMLSTLAYTHEITHTQLNHQKGIIKEYYNVEFLSIFNELLHAYFIDKKENMTLLDSHDKNRLSELKELIQELSKYHAPEDEEIREVLLESSGYLSSTIKAYSLFLKLYYGSDALRSEIIDSVQAVLDGDLMVEDLLLKFDISTDNIDDIKVLRRYSKRYQA